MRRTRTAIVTALVAASALAAAPTANADPGERGGFGFAVIGDIPYGDAQIARFPAVIDQINADPAVRFVDHLGDIKSGSSVCSDAYFSLIRSDFDRFADPLVYTPGDNEWTDCHRANNGSFNPLERLATIRKDFFPKPGKTLGQHSVGVESQARQGYPENVTYTRAGVAFVAVNIPGSNNSLVPWTGKTAPTAEQQAESDARTAADIALIKQAFAEAREEKLRSVVLLTQADMFDPTVPNPRPADFSGFRTLVATIAAESARFEGPVYLFNGDSHVFNQDKPLATGSSWLPFYGVTTAADNLTRITVDGSTGVNDYLRVVVTQDPAVLSVTKVPFN